MTDDESARGGSYTRDESEAHRLDRNYAELLQELRVAETGVQILLAFLLSIAFQARFGSIDGFERVVYVVTLAFGAVATALLIAPVMLHRLTFGERKKDQLVAATSRLAMAGICALMFAILGAVLLVLSLVWGRAPAIAATAILACVFIGLWYLYPLRHRYVGRRATAEEDQTRPRSGGTERR